MITLTNAIWLIGITQLGVLVGSSLVPVQLRWREILQPLPRLVQQLFWVYGAYVVLSIVALSLVCLSLPTELAAATPLARAVCLYGCVFWGLRLTLQLWLNAKPHLTTWCLLCGYHLLTLLFTLQTIVFGWGVFHGWLL